MEITIDLDSYFGERLQETAEKVRRWADQPEVTTENYMTVYAQQWGHLSVVATNLVFYLEQLGLVG